MLVLIMCLLSIALGVYGYFKYLTGKNKVFAMIELAGCMTGYKKGVVKLAQLVALFESGGFEFSNADAYKAAKNYYGMKQPKFRKTTSKGAGIGEGGFEIATYRSIYDSAKDFFLWCSAASIPKTATTQEAYEVMKSKGYMGTLETNPTGVQAYDQYMLDNESFEVKKTFTYFLLWSVSPWIVTAILAIVMAFYSKSGMSKVGSFFKKKSKVKPTKI